MQIIALVLLQILQTKHRLLTILNEKSCTINSKCKEIATRLSLHYYEKLECCNAMLGKRALELENTRHVCYQHAEESNADALQLERESAKQSNNLQRNQSSSAISEDCDGKSNDLRNSISSNASIFSLERRVLSGKDAMHRKKKLLDEV